MVSSVIGRRLQRAHTILPFHLGILEYGGSLREQLQCDIIVHVTRRIVARPELRGLQLILLLLVKYAEQCVRIMRYDIELHILFHVAPELEWLDSRCYCLNQHLAMLQRVLPTIGLHHLREPAVSEVFSQGTFSQERPTTYRHARLHLQQMEYLAAKILIIRLPHTNASTLLSPCLSSSPDRSTQGLPSENSSTTKVGSPNLPTLASSRALGLLHPGLRYASSIRTPSR